MYNQTLAIRRISTTRRVFEQAITTNIYMHAISLTSYFDHMQTYIFLLSAVFSTQILHSQSSLSATIPGKLGDTWKIKFTIYVEQLNGNILEGIDSNNNRLSVEVQKRNRNNEMIVVKYNDHHNNMRITELCGCWPCSHRDITIYITSVHGSINVQCNRSFRTMYFYFNKKNTYTGKITFSMANGGLRGCLRNFYFEKKKILFEGNGDRFSRCGRSNSPNETINRSTTPLNTKQTGTFETTNLTISTPQDSNSSIRTIKLTWPNTLTGRICLLELFFRTFKSRDDGHSIAIKVDNSSVTIGTEHAKIRLDGLMNVEEIVVGSSKNNTECIEFNRLFNVNNMSEWSKEEKAFLKDGFTANGIAVVIGLVVFIFTTILYHFLPRCVKFLITSSKEAPKSQEPGTAVRESVNTNSLYSTIDHYHHKENELQSPTRDLSEIRRFAIMIRDTILQSIYSTIDENRRTSVCPSLLDSDSSYVVPLIHSIQDKVPSLPPRNVISKSERLEMEMKESIIMRELVSICSSLDVAIRNSLCKHLHDSDGSYMTPINYSLNDVESPLSAINDLGLFGRLKMNRREVVSAISLNEATKRQSVFQSIREGDETYVSLPLTSIKYEQPIVPPTDGDGKFISY